MWLNDQSGEREPSGMPVRDEEAVSTKPTQPRRETSCPRECRWEIDRQFVITACSSESAVILGYLPEEMIGRPFPDFLAPGERERVLSILEEAAQTRRTIWDRTFWALARNGKRLLLAMSGMPVLSDREHCEGFRCVIRDITGQELAEEMLRESASKYRELADSLPQTVFELDFTGRVLFANRYSLEMFGYDHTDLERGLNAFDLIAPRDRERMIADVGRDMAGTGDPYAEYLALRKDGATFPILVYTTLIVRNGEPIGLRGVVVDITERKRTEGLMERIRDLALALGSTADLTQGLRMCLRATLEVSGLECGGFYLADNQGGLQLEIHEELSDEFLAAVSLYPPDSPNTRMVLRGRPIYSRTDELPPEISGDVIREGLRLLVMLPVFSRGRVIGCINLASRVVPDIPPVMRDTLEGLAAQVGNSIGRLQAETALRQSEEQYRTLIENSTDIVMRFDRQFRHQFVSNSIRRILGIGPEDFLGKTHRDIGFPPKLCEYWENRIGRVFITGDEFTDTFWLEIKRGSVLFDWKLIPERDAEGTVVSVLSLARDITEQSLMREELRQSESRFMFVASQIPGVIWATNRNLVFTFMAGASLSALGYTPDQVVGKALNGLMTGDDWENTVVPMHQRALTGEEVNYLYRFRELCFEITLEPLRDSSGNITGVLGLANDVTVRERERERAKLLERQLLQSQKMETIGRFAGGIAHDFNNILTVILTQADLALMLMEADNPFREAFEEVRKAGDRAAELTRKLLVFSRREIAEPRAINLNQVLLEMDKMFRRMIGENIELVTIPDESILSVRMDPGHIEQILINLALNARDAMPEGGTLTIETRNAFLDDRQAQRFPGCAPGKHVLLSVTDTGIGMDEETRSLAFEPFFTTKPEGSGTGLGLSTCYGIVRQNNGAVMIESVPGRGATVRVYLPASNEPVFPRPLPTAASDYPGGTETILVAEDDASIRALVVRLLKNAGYRVQAASNGTEALTMAGEITGPIDILVTDIIMPLMGGPTLAQHLTARRPDIRVLFMSGYTDDSVVRHGILDPGVAMIQKPFSTGAFLRKVREVLDAE